jgi:hypothetical protein
MCRGTLAHRIKPDRSLVTGSVTLSSRFHPNDGIDIGVVENLLVSGRSSTESSVLDIAPLTPLRPDTRLSGPTLVDDEVSRVTCLLEMRGEAVNVVPLVPAVAPFRVVLTNRGDVLVVVGYVDSETSDFGGGVNGFSAF